jgi:hypothetical protein
MPVPRPNKGQGSALTANIAGQQARIGDLEDALPTVQPAGSFGAQVSAAGGIPLEINSRREAAHHYVNPSP